MLKGAHPYLVSLLAREGLRHGNCSDYAIFGVVIAESASEAIEEFKHEYKGELYFQLSATDRLSKFEDFCIASPEDAHSAITETAKAWGGEVWDLDDGESWQKKEFPFNEREY